MPLKIGLGLLKIPHNLLIASEAGKLKTTGTGSPGVIKQFCLFEEHPVGIISGVDDDVMVMVIKYLVALLVITRQTD